MRIALYLPDLTGGGGERVMVTLANGLARRGHEATLVPARFVGPYCSRVHEGVLVRDLRSRGVGSSLPGLARYLRQSGPDILLSTLTHANVVAVLAGRFSRSTAVVLRQAEPISQSYAQGTTWRQRVLRTMLRPCYSRADGIIAVSEGVRRDLSGFLSIDPDSVTTLYSPLVSEQLLKEARAGVLPEGFEEVSAAGVMVLAMGRLSSEKGFDTLIEAVARVRRRRRVRLIILGEGELRAALESQASALGIGKDFSLPGFVDNPFPFLRAAGAFVLSSRWEGLPGSLVHAMLTGTPVIATECSSGIREILRQGRRSKLGELVPVDNPDALAQAIERSLDQGQDRGALKARAMDFHEDRVLEGFERYFEELIRHRTGAASRSRKAGYTS